jgi:O-antigen/teichoic acid export membrane protein
MLGHLGSLLKIDLRYVVKGTFWLTMANMIPLLIVFVQASVFARFIPPETYGLYRYLSAVVSLIGLASISAMNNALAIAISHKKFTVLKTGAAEQFRWSLASTVLSLTAAAISLLRSNYPFAIVFLIFGLSNPLLNFFSTYESYYTGTGKFKSGAVYSIIEKIISASFLIVIAVIFPSGFLYLFSIVYLIQLLPAGLIYIKTIKAVPHQSKSDNKTIKFAKRLSVFNILSAIVDQADTLIAFWVLGPVNLAIYSFAVSLPEIVKSQFKLIVPLSISKIGNYPHQEIMKEIKGKIFFISVGGFFCSLLYIILAPIIFSWYFPNYMAAVFPSQLISLSFCFFSSYLFYAILQNHPNKKPLYIYNSFGPIVQLFLIIILTVPFGLTGMVASRILGRAFAFLLGWYLTFRRLNG